MPIARGNDARPGVGAIRAQNIVSRNFERSGRIKIRFLDTNDRRRIQGNEMKKFDFPSANTSRIPLENGEGIRRERR